MEALTFLWMFLKYRIFYQEDVLVPVAFLKDTFIVQLIWLSIYSALSKQQPFSIHPNIVIIEGCAYV